MKKINYKNVICFITIIMLIIPIGLYSYAANGSAYTKEEIIYSLLNADGTVKSVYAVNSFELSEAAEITDKGNYYKALNMISSSEIKNDKGTVTFNAPKGNFYYQGYMDATDLPWKIDINYKLNGNTAKADELPGASGKIEIIIDIRQNKNINSEYFDNYTLQISVSLENGKFSNIKAGGATISAAGKYKTLIFNHMPKIEAKYTVAAETTDFELQPIQFAGTLVNMGGIMKEMTDITDGIPALRDGITALSDGASQLNGGIKQYMTGIKQFASQIAVFSNSSNEISKGLTQSSQGLSQLIAGSDQLKLLAESLSKSTDRQTQALAAGYLAQLQALIQISEGLTTINENYTKFTAGVEALKDGTAQLEDGFTEISEGMAPLADGISELNSQTSIFDDVLDKFTNDDYKPSSFTSKENKNTDTVQFVLKTPLIANIKNTAPIEKVENKSSFLQKFLELFKIK